MGNSIHGSVLHGEECGVHADATDFVFLVVGKHTVAHGREECTATGYRAVAEHIDFLTLAMDVVNRLAEVNQGSGHTARSAAIDDVTYHIVTVGSFHEHVAHFERSVGTFATATGHRTCQAENVDVLHIFFRDVLAVAVFIPFIIVHAEVGESCCIRRKQTCNETGNGLKTLFALLVVCLSGVQKIEHIGTIATEHRLLHGVVSATDYFVK